MWSWVALDTGGVALFLVGRMLLDKLSFNRFSRSRIVGLVLLAASLPLMIRIPLLFVTLTST